MINGTVKGKYWIYDEIGSGGCATVYLGRNLQTDELVAIKVLNAQFTGDPLLVERFRREAALALRLQHPNIVRVLDHGIEGQVHYLVMEYVAGQTLDAVLAHRGRLSLERTISYAEQTCSALQAAFEAGIIHRDIKPANLMITPEGVVKVMDFGMARVDTMDALTQRGMFLGTLGYASPEMARGSHADARSDLYSLGLIMYEMLAGSPPFVAKNSWEVLRMKSEGDPVPVHRVRPETPPWLEGIVFKALERDPARRFQTPAEMLASLQGHTPTPGPIPISLASMQRRDVKPEPMPSQPTSGNLVIALVLAIIVLVLAIVMLLVLGLGSG